MPNCFQLFPKGSKVAATLVSVDEAICAHVGVEPHKSNWYADWYNTIGFRLALGKTVQQMREEFQGYVDEGGNDGHYYVELLDILEFLDDNYTTSAWYEFKH